MPPPLNRSSMPAFKHLRTVSSEDVAIGNSILAEIWAFLQPSCPKPDLIFARQHASASAWLRQNSISIRYDSYRKWSVHVKRSVILHEVLHILGMQHLGFALDDLAHILRPQIWGLESEASYRQHLLDNLEKRLGHRLLPSARQQDALPSDISEETVREVGKIELL